MTKPKLAASSAVNLVVCVIKPGPIAEVAIRNAAPVIAPVYVDFLLSGCDLYCIVLFYRRPCLTSPPALPKGEGAGLCRSKSLYKFARAVYFYLKTISNSKKNTVKIYIL